MNHIGTDLSDHSPIEKQKKQGKDSDPVAMAGRKSQTHRPRSGPVRMTTTRASVGRFFRPPKNPPTIIENKWRFARLKMSGLAAGDAGLIYQITGQSLTAALKSQQGNNTTDVFMSFRIQKMMAYGFQGVGEGGGQAYPTVKIRCYVPENAQGILIDQREDQGTLEDIARIGYTYPDHYRNYVVNGGNSSSYFAQVVYYHSARMSVFVDVMWCTQPN